MTVAWFQWQVGLLAAATVCNIVQTLSTQHHVRGVGNLITLLVIACMTMGQCSPENENLSYVSHFIMRASEADDLACNVLPMLLVINFATVILDVYETYVSTAYVVRQRIHTNVHLLTASMSAYLSILGMGVLVLFNYDTAGKEWKHYLGVALLMSNGAILHMLTILALYHYGCVNLLLPPTTAGPVFTVQTETGLLVLFVLGYLGSAALLLIFFLADMTNAAIITEYLWLLLFALVSWVTTRSGGCKVSLYAEDSVSIFFLMLMFAAVSFLI